MSESIVFFPSFLQEYKTGLLFSMIEGLKVGENIRFICDADPTDFEHMIKEADIPMLHYSKSKNSSNRWEIKISKE